MASALVLTGWEPMKREFPVNVGAGTVQPVTAATDTRAPVTASLLTDVPIYSNDIEGELATPRRCSSHRFCQGVFGYSQDHVNLRWR
jgi:uncharacterized protein (DUF111 family)